MIINGKLEFLPPMQHGCGCPDVNSPCRAADAVLDDSWDSGSGCAAMDKNFLTVKDSVATEWRRNFAGMCPTEKAVSCIDVSNTTALV